MIFQVIKRIKGIQKNKYVLFLFLGERNRLCFFYFWEREVDCVFFIFGREK